MSILFYVAEGEGAADRLLKPLAWMLAPVTAGVAAGLLPQLTPLASVERGALAAMLAAFGATTWLLCPAHLLPLVRSSIRIRSAADPVEQS